MESHVLRQPDLQTPILVAGGGGFIGGWLAQDLLLKGYENVRCVDIKPLDEWFHLIPEFENVSADLRLREMCQSAVRERDMVFNLAADMGGMGFIELNKSACMLSSLINTHLIQAAKDEGSGRYFFASSACVYNAEKQTESDVSPLKESDAYPALPEDGYGWEKLFGERMLLNFAEDFGIQGRVARFHNVYGPKGTWFGGREKAPAALARKVAQAAISGSNDIEIWGDGEQTRSFTYIDDAVYGTQLLMWSEVSQPLNIGSEELISVNGLVTLLEQIAGVKLSRSYRLDAPLGVRGRNSDNTLIRDQLNWEPSTSLAVGMEKTYAWIYDQVLQGNE